MWDVFRRGALAMAAIALSPGAAAAQSNAIAPGFQPVAVYDQNGFEQPIPRFWLHAPQGWTLSGGQTLPNNPCHPGKYQSNWTATAPGQDFALTFYSDYASIARQANFPLQPIPGREGCPEFYIATAQDYLVQLAQAHRPNPQFLAYQKRDDLLARAGYQPTSSAMGGTASRQWLEIGDLIIRFQLNGQVFEEVIRAAVSFEHSAAQYPTVSGSVAIETYASEGLIAYSLVAPMGRLNFPFFEYVSSSVTMDPNWLRKLAAVRARAARAARASRSASGGQSVSDIIMDGWRKREAIRDAGHAKYVDSVREVDNFANPETGAVWELPSHYSHAWRMSPSGDFAVSNNPLFDPNVDWGTNATRLQRLE